MLWNSVANLYDIVTYFWDPEQDITSAWYNGPYNISLKEAQINKYNKILSFTNLKSNFRVLDVGCGWGNLLKYFKEKGAEELGISLSPKQVETCVKKGLNAKVADWRNIPPDSLGKFDLITCVEALEHFATPDDFIDYNKQAEVYRKFFKFCHQLLKPNGYLFIQTMCFLPPGLEVAKRVYYDVEAALNNDKLSNDRIFAELSIFYPNSCMPHSLNQLNEAASDYFICEKNINGREDYVVTMNEWRKFTNKINLKKLLYYIKFTPSYLMDRKFRIAVASSNKSNNQECLKRWLWDLERVFYKKI